MIGISIFLDLHTDAGGGVGTSTRACSCACSTPSYQLASSTRCSALPGDPHPLYNHHLPLYNHHCPLPPSSLSSSPPPLYFSLFLLTLAFPTCSHDSQFPSLDKYISSHQQEEGEGNPSDMFDKVSCALQGYHRICFLLLSLEL